MIGESTEKAIQCGIKWENGYTWKVMKLLHITKTLQSNMQYSYYIFGKPCDQILTQTLDIMLFLSPTIQILRYYLKLCHN